MCQACPIQFTHDYCSLRCVRPHGPRSCQIQGGPFMCPGLGRTGCWWSATWTASLDLCDICCPSNSLLTHLLNVRIPQNSALGLFAQAGPPRPVCQWLWHLSLKADITLETCPLPPPPPQGCLSVSVWDWCQPPVFPCSTSRDCVCFDHEGVRGVQDQTLKVGLMY